MKEETRQGVVVFLDALGVSDYNLKKCRNFIEKRDEIIKELDFVTKKWGIQIEKDLKQILLKPNIVTFQDSIILWWPEQKENSLHFFCGAAHVVTAILNLAIEKRIFLRGAISVGEYVYDESKGNVTIIGPAVSEAYKYHGIADWIGVIQTPTFQEEYRKLLESIAKRKNLQLDLVIEHWSVLFVRQNIPLHNEKNGIKRISMEPFYVVSWPQIEKNEGDRILEILIAESNRPENAKFKAKYENSIRFSKWYRKNIFIPVPKTTL
jgi:hypothetical protein